MLLIAGTIRLPPANLAAARPIMQAMVAASRAEPGCIRYSYAEDLFDPGLIHISELWHDRPALDLHFATDHIAQWRAAWPDLGIGERNLVLYAVGDAQAV